MICPYCLTPIVESSKDHVFPISLGGGRTIQTCGPCNNRFGHEFEAQSIKMLKEMQVSMSTWGLSFSAPAPSWRRALEIEGIKFDLSSNPKDPEFRLSVPIKNTDNKGNLTSITYATQQEAERAVENNLKKGKPARLEKIAIESSYPNVPFYFEINSELKRTAFKMCLALSNLFPGFSADEFDIARMSLTKESSTNNANPIFSSLPLIDGLRQPLSHLIYIERSQGQVHGVVQFFGVIQLYCRLGIAQKTASEIAFLGVLDPVTGEESFSEKTPNFALLNPFSTATDQPIEAWLEKFRDSAIARGATEPIELTGKIHIREI